MKKIYLQDRTRGDNFYDKYVKKFYDGTLGQNWAPGVTEKYKANPEVDSLFLVKVAKL